jgi:hypothetical protein
MNCWPTCKRSVIVILMVCFATFAHSSAQESRTGQISGHVVDVVGATIKGASIFVRRATTPPDDNIKLLTHTDIHGDFTLVLPEGGYDVLVTSPGFAANVETVPVLARKTMKVQWKLKVLSCNFPGVNCDTFQ